MRKKNIDKIPGRLDFTQSFTGLILGLFIMGHILFEASILFGNEMMYRVTIMFEGYYFFGETYPIIISILASIVSVIFVIHAGIAVRKFPNNYIQHKVMREHIVRMKHEDSSLWIIQITTGFLMFFVGSVHLYGMIADPSNIGPFASAYRIVQGNMAPLYILLLFSVVSHAFIGLYRLALKWGFMEGKNSKKSRKFFKQLMKIFIITYLIIGSLSLARYIQIGSTHNYEETPRYKSQVINHNSNK